MDFRLRRLFFRPSASVPPCGGCAQAKLAFLGVHLRNPSVAVDCSSTPTARLRLCTPQGAMLLDLCWVAPWLTQAQANLQRLAEMVKSACGGSPLVLSPLGDLTALRRLCASGACFFGGVGTPLPWRRYVLRRKVRGVSPLNLPTRDNFLGQGNVCLALGHRKCLPIGICSSRPYKALSMLCLTGSSSLTCAGSLRLAPTVVVQLPFLQKSLVIRLPKRLV